MNQDANNLAYEEFWSSWREKKTVVEGLKPLAWNEAAWRDLKPATKEAVALIARWVMESVAAIVLRLEGAEPPRTGESLFEQSRRAKLPLTTEVSFWLAVLAGEVGKDFEIGDDPAKAELARNAFLVACYVVDSAAQQVDLSCIMAERSPGSPANRTSS